MPRVDAYLQIAEAAEMLRICQNTLRNWGRAGKVTEYRHPVNNYRLYKHEELNNLVRQLESPKPAPTHQAKAKNRPRRLNRSTGKPR